MIIKTRPRSGVLPDSLYVKYLVQNRNEKRLTLFLLPGGPGADHSIYQDQAEVFFEWVDIVMFDPRGCGKSTLADSSCYSMEVYINDIEDIRKQLKLDKIVVLGTSYGSMVAQGYAVKHGLNVLQSLILVAGAPSYEFIAAASVQLEKIGSKDQINAFKRLLSGHIATDNQLREYFKIMAPLYSIAAQEGKTFHSAKKDIRYNAEAALAGFGPSGFLRKFDWRGKLPGITCPTFIIVGEEDWINRPGQAKEMVALIPKSRLIVVAKSGHFVWVDKKEEYLTAITSFLKACASAFPYSKDSLREV